MRFCCCSSLSVLQDEFTASLFAVHVYVYVEKLVNSQSLCLCADSHMQNLSDQGFLCETLCAETFDLLPVGCSLND